MSPPAVSELLSSDVGPASTSYGRRVRYAYEALRADFERWTPSAAFTRAFDNTALAEIARRLEIGPSVDVLEVGCGHGSWAERLYDRIESADDRVRYTGIDFCESRVAFGRDRLARHPSIRLVTADAETYEPPMPIDVLLAVEVISHVPSDRHAAWLARWCRWLRPGGSFVVIDKDRFSRHSLRVRLDYFRRRLPKRLRGVRYYFPDHFDDLLGTLHYPSFRRLACLARRQGFSTRPVFRCEVFRALIGDLPK